MCPLNLYFFQVVKSYRWNLHEKRSKKVEFTCAHLYRCKILDNYLYTVFVTRSQEKYFVVVQNLLNIGNWNV